MKPIQRNDCVYTAPAFYDHAIGYVGVMGSAAIETPIETPLGEAGEREEGSVLVLCTADLAECTCPDACERDHDRD